MAPAMAVWNTQLKKWAQVKCSQSIPLAAEDPASFAASEVMADSLQQISLAGGSSSSTPQSSQSQSSQSQPTPLSQQATADMSSPAPVAPVLKALKAPAKWSHDATGKNEKIQPSAKSGGIPQPTAEYMQLARVVPRLLPNPQDLLIVIDLNGTLLYRPNKKCPTKFLSRPHAPLFLKYCIDTFKVVIWSSARQENVTAMCNAILTPEMRSKVVAIWSRERFNLTHSDYNLRVICYKRLTSIWKDTKIAGSHPAFHLGGTWDQTNTVLIDDSVEKGRSEPYNLIEIPEWNGDFEDVALPQVHDHLNQLSLHSNVSGHLYTQPFRPSRRGWVPDR